MLRPQHLLTHRQGTFPERFRLPVLASLIEVKPGLKEQVSRFPKRHAPSIYMLGTQQRMRDITLTVCPRLVVHLRKALRDRSHDSCCPLGLSFCSQLVFHHLLHHTVETIGLGI